MDENLLIRAFVNDAETTYVCGTAPERWYKERTMVVKDVTKLAPTAEKLAGAGYPTGAPIPEGFDEHDDPYLSLPAFVDRIDEAKDEVTRLGLERQAFELHTLGYTKIEPERIGPPEFIQEVLRATLDVAKRRRGIDYNITNGAPELNLYGRGEDKDANERYILLESDKRLLFEDPVFEKVLMNEQVLALVTMMIRQGAQLGQMYSLDRHANTPPLPLHTDPTLSPFPSFPTYMAAQWCLTDFNDVRDGATCYVPGSQKLLRRPTKREGYVHMAHARSVYAPAGSVLVHNGAIWHGAPTRQAGGVRVSVNLFYKKGNLQSLDGYRGHEPEGVLERNPPRFAHLLGHLVHDDKILTHGEVVDSARGAPGEGYSIERRAATTARGGGCFSTYRFG
jgi:ectoine hydroxylase-related dioxygenase (phytanoyl-CoA dioxygenase family)